MLFALAQSGKKLSPSLIGTGWYPYSKAKLSGAYSDFKLSGKIVSKGGSKRAGSMLASMVYPYIKGNNPRTCPYADSLHLSAFNAKTSNYLGFNLLYSSFPLAI